MNDFNVLLCDETLFTKRYFGQMLLLLLRVTNFFFHGITALITSQIVNNPLSENNMFLSDNAMVACMDTTKYACYNNLSYLDFIRYVTYCIFLASFLSSVSQ